MLGKKLAFFVFLVMVPLLVLAQGYFLPKGQKFEKIKFELINNLIIIPVEINGAELTFILDSGVSKPILFNLSQSDSIPINNVSEVTIRGLGTGEPMKALSSKSNIFRLGNAKKLFPRSLCGIGQGNQLFHLIGHSYPWYNGVRSLQRFYHGGELWFTHHKAP